jgi:hypothetical protein
MATRIGSERTGIVAYSDSTYVQRDGCGEIAASKKLTDFIMPYTVQ